MALFTYFPPMKPHVRFPQGRPFPGEAYPQLTQPGLSLVIWLKEQIKTRAFPKGPARAGRFINHQGKVGLNCK